MPRNSAAIGQLHQAPIRRPPPARRFRNNLAGAAISEIRALGISELGGAPRLGNRRVLGRILASPLVTISGKLHHK